MLNIRNIFFLLFFFFFNIVLQGTYYSDTFPEDQVTLFHNLSLPYESNSILTDVLISSLIYILNLNI